jgi:hypothetical protein
MPEAKETFPEKKAIDLFISHKTAREHTTARLRYLTPG